MSFIWGDYSNYMYFGLVLLLNGIMPCRFLLVALLGGFLALGCAEKRAHR